MVFHKRKERLVHRLHCEFCLSYLQPAPKNTGVVERDKDHGDAALSVVRLVIAPGPIHIRTPHWPRRNADSSR